MQVEDFCFLIIHSYRYLIILEKTSPRFFHVEEFTYLSVTKKEGVSQTYDTPSSLYKSLSISKVIHIYIMYCSIFTCSS